MKWHSWQAHREQSRRSRRVRAATALRRAVDGASRWAHVAFGLALVGGAVIVALAWR